MPVAPRTPTLSLGLDIAARAYQTRPRAPALMQVKARAAAVTHARRMIAPPPTTAHANRLATALAATAATLLTAMVAITAATGVAQEPFEVIRPDYAVPAIADAARRRCAPSSRSTRCS
jgi:hypothetical protein